MVFLTLTEKCFHYASSCMCYEDFFLRQIMTTVISSIKKKQHKMAIKCRVVVQIGPNGVLELLCRAYNEELKQTAA